MRALVMNETGGPSVLMLDQRAEPSPGSGEVLLRVAGCGLCGHDQADRLGITRVPLPCILGHEVAGIVAELGAGVTRCRVGDRVACRPIWGCGSCAQCLAGRDLRCADRKFLYGGLAEYVVVHESTLAPVPDGMDLVDAAIVGCALATVVQALRTVARVDAGENVVVTGASGGLGLHAVQVVSALGGHPIAITSSPGSVEQLTDLGAEVVVAGENGYWQAILDMTGGKGADVVLDNIGLPATFDNCFRALAHGGRYVFTGQVSKQRVGFYPKHLFAREAMVTGSAAATAETLTASLDMVASGMVRPVVERFAFEDIVGAFSAVDDRRVLGRAVMVP